MAKAKVKSKRIINCTCNTQKKYTTLTQSDNCICYIGTSMDNQKRVWARRVNVTKVSELSDMDLGVGL
tara:strand:- start:407 stop:610 length:204 start_codon:yes stop_codon:yes gene_type:complete